MQPLRRTTRYGTFAILLRRGEMFTLIDCSQSLRQAATQPEIAVDEHRGATFLESARLRCPPSLPMRPWFRSWSDRWIFFRRNKLAAKTDDLCYRRFGLQFKTP